MESSDNSSEPSTKRKRHEKHTSSVSTLGEKDPLGIIESISLQNFMCHGRLTMKFPGSVNFIVGNNGSGKSAILTALIVGLGGKTSSTSRGTSLKSLIKTGSSYAVVQVGMRNNGDFCIKPDLYGDRILVERKITSDGQSSYKIKNSVGKVVSNKKEDLLQMLDHMNLQVDNPLTCLNQEMSKNFLHSKTEGDKYKFFLKSTQLDQMCKDYKYIKEQEENIVDIIKLKERALPGLVKEINEKEDKFKNLATLRELQTKKEKLCEELAWSGVAQLEHNLKSFQKELKRAKLHTPVYEMEYSAWVNKEMEAKAKFDELQKLVETHQEEVRNLHPEKQKCKEKYDKCKVEFKQLERDRNRAQRRRKQLQQEKKDLELKISQLKNTVKADTENQIKKQKLKLEQLQRQTQELHTQVNSFSHQIRQFVHADTEVSEKLEALKQEETETKLEQRKIQQAVSNLSAGKQNKLKLFGPKMPDFVNKINAAYQRKQFNKKPKGPIGSHISLRDPSLALPIECAIGHLLSCFVVDNHADEKVLEKLRNSIFAEHERPRITIYTQRFADKIYDVSKGKAKHPTYHSVFDLLVMNDPVVANCLIDIASIESILVIPEIQDALHVMQNSAPTPHCSRAFTKEGDEVFTDRFYSNNRSSHSSILQADVEAEIQRSTVALKAVGERLSNIKSQINMLTKEKRENENQKKNHEKSKAAASKKLHSITMEIREVEMIEEPQPLDIKDLEDEVSNYIEQIKGVEVLVEENETSFNKAQNDLMEAKKACEKVQDIMKDIVEKADEFTERINAATSDLEHAKAEQSHLNEAKQKNLQEIAKMNKNIDTLQASIDVESKKAFIICPVKIETRRTPKNIENEIRQINRRISQEEKTQGDAAIVVKEYNEVQQKFKSINKQLEWARGFHKDIMNYLSSRKETYSKIQSYIAIRCNLDFQSLLYQRGFHGQLTFNHEEQILLISIQPNDAASQTIDSRTLSGGERSFSTVCFLLALWRVIESPLRCLDEFDVFMDMANRRVALDLMVETSLAQKYKQFIFLTPHDISALPKLPQIHVWKMARPKRGLLETVL